MAVYVGNKIFLKKWVKFLLDYNSIFSILIHNQQKLCTYLCIPLVDHSLINLLVYQSVIKKKKVIRATNVMIHNPEILYARIW